MSFPGQRGSDNEWGTAPLGRGQFELLSQSLDSALDSPYPCFSRSFLFSLFRAARFCMVLHVFVVLLVVCLLLCLALLWRLDWFPLRSSSSRGGAKRTALQRLLKPRTPDDCSACRLASTPASAVGLAPAPVRRLLRGQKPPGSTQASQHRWVRLSQPKVPVLRHY